MGDESVSGAYHDHSFLVFVEVGEESHADAAVIC